jgi:hypothetical protein
LTDTKPSIFRGSPRPVSEVFGFGGVPPTQEVADAVKSIPVGQLLETTLTRSGASSLLERLVRHEMIKPNTYRVRTKKMGSVQAVFIEHKAPSSAKSARQSKRVRADAASMPSPEEIARFISGQQDKEHTLNSVAQQFLKRQINAHSENALYHRLGRVIAQARTLITQQDGGRFVEERAGRTKTFHWTK